MAYTPDPRVDAYINALPKWQQRICQHVRDLVHEADPEVAETIKRTVQPYFVLEGNICARLAKTQVPIGRRRRSSGCGDGLCGSFDPQMTSSVSFGPVSVEHAPARRSSSVVERGTHKPLERCAVGPSVRP